MTVKRHRPKHGCEAHFISVHHLFKIYGYRKSELYLSRIISYRPLIFNCQKYLVYHRPLLLFQILFLQERECYILRAPVRLSKGNTCTMDRSITKLYYGKIPLSKLQFCKLVEGMRTLCRCTCTLYFLIMHEILKILNNGLIIVRFHFLKSDCNREIIRSDVQRQNQTCKRGVQVC